MPAAGGPRTNVVPGGSVRVVPPRGSVIGGGARIMRTWFPPAVATIMVVPGGAPGLPDAFAAIRLLMAILPGTVVNPPWGEAMRSRMVCMGWVVAPGPSRGPASRGVTIMPGGRLGTRYVTRAGAASCCCPCPCPSLSAPPPAAEVTVPVAGVSTTEVPEMLTRVIAGRLDVGGICTSDVGAALNTGMPEDGTAIFWMLPAIETEMTLA